MSKSSDALNAMFAADPAAIYSLITNHTPCNEVLSNDPHAPIGTFKHLPGERWRLGAMSLVNAVLSANGLPLVASVWNESEDSETGPKFCGFAEYTP